MIGKAERGPVAIEAIRKHGAAYLMAVGGAAYLVSKAIRGSRVVAFGDLGMEAIYEFDVKDMPVTVAVDARGESVHHTAPEALAGADRQDPGQRRVARACQATRRRHSAVRAVAAAPSRAAMAHWLLYPLVDRLANLADRHWPSCWPGSCTSGAVAQPAPARRSPMSARCWKECRPCSRRPSTTSR